MTDTNDLDLTPGVSRRRVLVRGAVLGGVVWAAPAVTTVGSSAFGQTTGSPPPIDTDISYIALNVTCGGTQYFIKWESDDNEWEDDPSLQSDCVGVLNQTGTPTDGGDLGFTVTGSTNPGCVIITVPAGCTVNGSAMKWANECHAGPSGTGSLEFCRT